MLVREMAEWETFAHDADIGVRGFGLTPAQAFENAGLAMTAVICDPARVTTRQEIEIVCDEPSIDFLFMDWLNQLVFEMATRNMLFGRFQVEIQGNRLSGRAWGEPVEPARHKPAVEVKGATLTELKVGRDAQGRWVAQCVVDV